MSFITIDNYYDINFYNECLQALRNNKINFSEFVYIKQPYNFYIEMDETPVMVNYDTMNNSKIKFLVRKTIPLRPNEIYLYQRRVESKSDITRYIDNDALKSSDEYGIFFTVSSKENLERISRDFPGKIWYFGKHYNNKFRVCYCNNPMIKNFILSEQILVQKTSDMKEPGRLEAELNFRIFKNKDFLKKYSETLSIENGIIKRPKIIDANTVNF